MTDLLSRLPPRSPTATASSGSSAPAAWPPSTSPQDLKHDRKVAVKVLRPELAAVIGAERFLSEIKTTANLQHPHILPLFDSGEADGFLFYVMPFVEGESLRDRLDREKQLPVADAVRHRHARSPARSTTPTATASSTATSSPRTSCCTTAARWWPTSASPSPRAEAPAAPG